MLLFVRGLRRADVIVVVAIVGVLASLVIPAIQKVREKG